MNEKPAHKRGRCYESCKRDKIKHPAYCYFWWAQDRMSVDQGLVSLMDVYSVRSIYHKQISRIVLYHDRKKLARSNTWDFLVECSHSFNKFCIVDQYFWFNGHAGRRLWNTVGWGCRRYLVRIRLKILMQTYLFGTRDTNWLFSFEVSN